MNEFGVLLRSLRKSCRDRDGVSLSQQKLGELVGEKLGTVGYSGAAVSDWERGKSKIHADDRLVLAAMIRVFHEYGAIKGIEDANQLLGVGNYRALRISEIQNIFKDFSNDVNSARAASQKKISSSNALFFLAAMLSISSDELDALLAKTKEGPSPSWPRILVVFMRKASEQFSLSIYTILWVGVWFFAKWLIGPSLRLPFADRDLAFRVLWMYAIGSLIIPLWIGLLVNTKDNEYWSQQNTINPFFLRLYTYQGAGIGFNLGYFLVLPFSFARAYLGLDPAIWIEFAAATAGLILGNMGARVVPHNLWLAYKRLNLSDGGIFFVVALIGPLWSVFFFQFYSLLLTPALGIMVVLLALSMIVIIARRQTKNTR